MRWCAGMQGAVYGDRDESQARRQWLQAAGIKDRIMHPATSTSGNCRRGSNATTS